MGWHRACSLVAPRRASLGTDIERLRTTKLAIRDPPSHSCSVRRNRMLLRWALIFLVVALIAAVLGFGGIAGGAADFARILFYLFLAVFVVSLIMGLVRRA